MANLLRPALVKPAYFTHPEYTQTLGPEVCDLAVMAGYAPDPEQELALNAMFALSPTKRTLSGQVATAAFEFAVVCSRQNMKTGLLKMAALGWLFITDQRLVVWSSHEMDTTEEAFDDIVNLIQGTPLMSKRLDPDFGKEDGVKRGNGKQLIKLRPSEACPHGQRLKFKARTKSGGRGLTGNKVILDEAMYLQPSQLSSLVPTLSAVDDPQLVYGGSAGLAESVVWRGIRDRGRPGGDPALAYMEYCSQPEENACLDEACTHALGVEGCALDDIEYIRQANPALERRISIEYIRNERRTLATKPDEYGRERAGWWDKPDAGSEALIKPDVWTNLADPLSEPVDPVAFGLYTKIDRTASAIGVVGRRADGKLHVGIVPAVRGKSIDSLPGTAWIPDRIKELVDQWKPCAVVVDGHSAAASLITTIEGLGVEVVKSNATDLAKACGAFYDAVTADPDSAASLRHRGASPLTRSATSAKRRDLSDAWAWDRKDKDSDITQLMAVTLALHGLIEHGTPETVEVWGFLS
ncbi:Gp2 [Mycolicibacterium canariasense]|uniref:Gp2 n=1 Tax=Mycolicibacterium canariasense TaxID=228230 RepID=A0A100WBL0_MYCCR|nr:hypothetical protein [Mycolicibacterium canariasense]GAS95474.1 Gp2 [Mycolicibacterium canariasense]